MMILPYKDCRHPDQVAKTVEGLGFWARCTKTAIIEVGQGRFGVYDDIKALMRRRRACRGMRIIPSLAIGTFLVRAGHFDDGTQWNRIGIEVGECLARTGGDTVVLDMESAVEHLCTMRNSFRSVDLAWALERLPAGVRYLWRPGPQMSHSVLRQNVAVALAIASHVRDVRPFTSNYAAPGLDWLRQYQDGHAYMRLLSPGQTMVAHLCCGSRRTRYWAWRDIPDVIARLPGEIWGVTIFPGSAGWVRAAQYLAPKLKARFRTPPGP